MRAGEPWENTILVMWCNMATRRGGSWEHGEMGSVIEL